MTKANLNRRGVLAVATTALAGSAAAVPTLAGTSHPDAGLLALEQPIEAIAARLRAATKVMNAAEAVVEARRPPRPEAPAPCPGPDALANLEEQRRRFTAWLVEGRRLMVDCGYDEAEERVSDLETELDRALWPVREVAATTLEGFRFKARMARHDPTLAEVIVRDLLSLDATGAG
jgi:hypothetical protein